MKQTTVIIGLLITIVLFACKPNGKSNLLPTLAASDSAIVMYYHQVGNPRFFNMTKVYEKSFINAVATAVNKNTIDAKDTCTTEGKIYLYGKNGAVETIYFSRVPGCFTLSFIKTGEKYFAAMPATLAAEINVLEKKAIILPGRK